MCRGTEFPAWEARCIEHLLALDGVEPALLIVDDDPPPAVSTKSRIRRLLSGKGVLWRIYQRAFLNRRSLATRSVNLSSVLSNVPVIRCRAERTGRYRQCFKPEDITHIRSCQLDFILRFSFNILGGDILSAARHGIWSFHHGDPDKYRGTPPGFWEIYNRDLVTGAVLQRLTERLDAGVMLYRGYFNTLAYSYPQSRDQAYLGGADWPARICKDIQNGKAAYLDAEPSPTAAAVYRDPTNAQMLRFMVRWAAGWLRNQAVSLFRHQDWAVGVIDAPIHEAAGLAATGATKPPSVRWLPKPAGRFLADPFGISRYEDREGGLTILAEDFDWSEGRGCIVSIASPDGQTFEVPRRVIELPCHMSYPFLFEHEGSIYCVPETHQACEVALYRANSSLREWSKIATLIRGFPAVDPTIFHHGGHWWLFCTNEDLGANTKLFAWHAVELAGPWIPHAGNPLKTDVRSSRPAGTPFVHAGQLYRPSQDCSTGYGAAVVLNRVDRLDPQEFSEELVSVLRPDPAGPYPDGLHTLAMAGDRTVIDGSRRLFVREAFQEAVTQKLRRILKKPAAHEL